MTTDAPKDPSRRAFLPRLALAIGALALTAKEVVAAPFRKAITSSRDLAGFSLVDGELIPANERGLAVLDRYGFEHIQKRLAAKGETVTRYSRVIAHKDLPLCMIKCSVDCPKYGYGCCLDGSCCTWIDNPCRCVCLA